MNDIAPCSQIAEDIEQQAAARGLRAKASTMDAFGWEGLSAASTPRIVFVLSTHYGSPPANAAAFCAAAGKAAAGALTGVQISVLGLGDSAFGADEFCKGEEGVLISAGMLPGSQLAPGMMGHQRLQRAQCLAVARLACPGSQA